MLVPMSFVDYVAFREAVKSIDASPDPYRPWMIGRISRCLNSAQKALYPKGAQRNASIESLSSSIRWMRQKGPRRAAHTLTIERGRWILKINETHNRRFGEINAAIRINSAPKMGNMGISWGGFALY